MSPETVGPGPRHFAVRSRRLCAIVAVLAVLAAACGGDDETSTTEKRAAKVTLVTHDSFAVSEGVFEGFTDDTGIKVEVLRSGDAGAALNQLILTKDDPIGDVFYGIDNTFLSRGLDEDLFVPYEAAGLDQVPDELILDDENRVTPIDYGDVCVNYDKQWFADEGLDPPATLDDLADARYAGLTVVENPANSSPGLAFLLGTVALYGEGDRRTGEGGAYPSWQEYWTALRDNGVEVAEDWEAAYYGSFTAGGEGDRPVVVSYASSPPADVVFSDPPREEPNIGVAEETCFRQVEFAAIIAGTDDEAAARKLVDFLLSPTFQEDMPLNMFVFPARSDADLPPVFTEWAATPEEPLSLTPGEIDKGRDRWIGEWTDLLLR